jgi:uncharacterized protein involved in exopolysaccharide biosynthesis
LSASTPKAVKSEVNQLLQTLAPQRPNEFGTGDDDGQSLDVSYYLGVVRRRIFYFLLPFGLISILGLLIAALQKPNYLSEGKILVESQRIAPDLVRPISTATASERIQLIQQRILTRDILLATARKFGLFSNRSGVADLMRQSILIKPVEAEGQPRQSASAIAFTVGFEHENPELAMRVANEFVTLIVDEDTRSRNSRASEAVKILSAEAKDSQEKLEAAQSQILEIARRPRDSIPEAPEREKSQIQALASLKAELIQKASVYSDAHPAVTALKKRIAAMEKSITQPERAPEKAQSTQAEEISALKRQTEVIEKRLAETNAKLAAARLSEKMDRDQQSEQLQVIESPQIPLKPLKSGRLKLAGVAFALALAVGVGVAMAREMFDGSIRSRNQLARLVSTDLIVSIPYMTSRVDVVRARLRTTSILLMVTFILVTLCALMAAIVFQYPVEQAFAQFVEPGSSLIAQ